MDGDKRGEEGNKKKENVCPLCEKSFTKKQSLFGHLQSHGLKKGKYNFDCQECQLRCTSLSQYWKHQRLHGEKPRPFQCGQCEEEQSFERQSQLSYHCDRDHKRLRPHKCGDCSKSFYKKSDLATHAKLHAGVRDYACDVCHRQFSHVSNLNRHKLTHKKEKPFACQLCGQRYNQIATLNQHQKKKHDDLRLCNPKRRKNKRFFHCQFCGEKFPHLAQLDLHRANHKKKAYPFSCKRCKKGFSRLSGISLHQCQQPSSSDLDLFKHHCLKNNEADKDDEDDKHDKLLVIEQRTQEVEGHLSKIEAAAEANNVSCSETTTTAAAAGDWVNLSSTEEEIKVDQRFMAQLDLDEADIFVTPLEISALTLPVTTASSVVASDVNHEIYEQKLLLPVTAATSETAALKIVVDYDDNNKDGHFLCSVCKKRFSRLDSFKQHFATHDQSLASACPECGIKFAWASTLRRHREKFHNLPPSQGSRKVFQCDLCSRQFKSKRHLKVHKERDHLGIRQHLCQICDKAFYSQNDLTSHVRVHTGEKPFSCSLCGKGFSHRSHQLRHERETHK